MNNLKKYYAENKTGFFEDKFLIKKFDKLFLYFKVNFNKNPNLFFINLEYQRGQQNYEKNFKNIDDLINFLERLKNE